MLLSNTLIYWLWPAYLTAAIVVCYWGTRSGPFLLDDIVIMSNMGDLFRPNREWPIKSFLKQLWRHRHPRRWLLLVRSRPLTVLTYRVDFLRSRLKPEGYHRTNIRIHVISTLLVFYLALHWFSLPGAMTASLLFAVHPLATSAVGYISGRSSALCGCFMIASIGLAAGHHWLLAALYALLAALSKEESILLPFLLGGAWWLGLL